MWLWTRLWYVFPAPSSTSMQQFWRCFFQLLPFSLDVFCASMDSAVVVAHAELPNPHLWGLIQPQSKKCNEEFRPWNLKTISMLVCRTCRTRAVFEDVFIFLQSVDDTSWYFMILHANVETLTDGGDGPGFGWEPTPSLTGPKAAPSSKQNLTVTNENTLPYTSNITVWLNNLHENALLFGWPWCNSVQWLQTAASETWNHIAQPQVHYVDLTSRKRNDKNLKVPLLVSFATVSREKKMTKMLRWWLAGQLHPTC